MNLPENQPLPPKPSLPSGLRELPVLNPHLELNAMNAVKVTSAISAAEAARRPLSPSRAREIAAEKKPAWLKIRPPAGENYHQIKEMLNERKLHTVCQEARCPNVAECWASGTATFMLGGDTCTRACRFCAIKTMRRPPDLDPNEPDHIASSVATLGLHYVVLTSVDRDDMVDGGAEHFAKTVSGIKTRNPKILVEALVSDFRGRVESIEAIVDSGVDVYAHNIETVKALQYRVRDPRANYDQSLETLKVAKRIAAERRESAGRKPMFTKSSIMLGLGETEDELKEAFADLRAHGADVLTLGQYLRPTATHLPVERFYSPEEFAALEEIARDYGFLYIAAGPLVRSSYRAGEFFIQSLLATPAG